LSRFKAWVRIAERELFLTFVVLTIVSVIITCLLVTATLGTDNAELAGNLTGMITREGEQIERVGGLWLRIVFILGGAFVIFSTQLAIIDTVTRIAGSVFFERYGRLTRFWTQKRTFLLFLTAFVLASMAIISASWFGGEALSALQPDFLLLVAGPFTMSSMFAFTLVVGVMNANRLPAELSPPMWKRWGMIWAAVLWGWFTAEQLTRTTMSLAGVERVAVESLAAHPIRVGLYAVWLAAVAWFARRLLSRREREA